MASLAHRGVRRLAAVALAAACVVSSLAPPGAGAGAAPAVSRLAGADRYATAVAISQAGFAPGVPVVFVATGASFPDALTGGPAAAARHAPVLLVERDRVPAVTADELARLRPGAIAVLGGAASVSDAVVAALDPYTDGAVTRLAGADRFATAAAVSAATFASGAPVAFVANGLGFPDALAGGPAAGVAGGPLLLVTPGELPTATAAELRRLRPASIVILGGTGAVGDGVERQLRALAAQVGRSEGADRYGTAAAVSANAFSPGVPAVYLATGTSFPDALAGGPLAARAPGPVLLVTPSCIPAVVNREIDRLAPGRIVILGGTGAVGDAVAARAECVPADATPATPVVSPAGTPAFDGDAPDPALLRVGGTWYAYTTGTTWGNRIGVLVSDRPDGGWRTLTGKPYGSTALPSIPSWQVPDTQWAPGVFAWAGRYVLFYAAQAKATGRWCLSVATASSPAGPFTDSSAAPIVCQDDLGGAIDPQPFVDGNGQPWLHWKNNDGESGSPAVSRVWAAPLTADGTRPAAFGVEVLAKDSVNHPWQTTVDNPQMVLRDGVHYLFFSGGDYTSAAYAVGYAVCDGPAGPCTQPQRDPILSSYGSVAGPAGGTVAADAGGSWWIAYHAWTAGCTSYQCGGVRRLYVAPLQFR